MRLWVIVALCGFMLQVCAQEKEKALMTKMADQKNISLLDDLKQPHLLEGYSQLTPEEKKAFFSTLAVYNSHLLKKQRAQMKESATKSFCEGVTPIDFYETQYTEQNRETGLKLLKEGKIGCIVLAGGQGTRLGFPGPKGCVPITPIKKKSLFQLVAEKCKAASKLAEKPL